MVTVSSVVKKIIIQGVGIIWGRMKFWFYPWQGYVTLTETYYDSYFISTSLTFTLMGINEW